MKIQKGNITSRIELSPGEDVGIHPSHTLNFTNVDALNIQDTSGFPWLRFFKGYQHSEQDPYWHEAYFVSNGGFTFLLNLMNTRNDKEVGIRLWKGDHPNQWCILIPSQPGYKFAIIRDALIDAFVLDEDGRLIIGRLPPNDYGPPEGRFHVRGMIDEIQAIVEAAASQSDDIFEVTSNGRKSKHFVVSAEGNVGVGTETPRAQLDVGGTAHHTGLAQAFPYNGELEPGEVAVIDTNDRLKVKRSEKAYETAIAGVVSQSPAIRISPQNHERTVPLTLSGSVSVKVTDENGPIEAGDGLTTSSTSGCAMKFQLLEAQSGMGNDEMIELINENERRRNAVLGKALESFTQGTGEIMALVS